MIKGSLASVKDLGRKPGAGGERLDAADDRAAGAVIARGLVIAAVLALAACGGGGGSGTSAPVTYVKLDGTPRAPNDEGVVTAMADDLSSITIDDARTYHTDPALQELLDRGRLPQPLRRRLHQYVQVGTTRHERCGSRASRMSSSPPANRRSRTTPGCPRTSTTARSISRTARC